MNQQKKHEEPMGIYCAFFAFLYFIKENTLSHRYVHKKETYMHTSRRAWDFLGFVIMRNVLNSFSVPALMAPSHSLRYTIMAKVSDTIETLENFAITHKINKKFE